MQEHLPGEDQVGVEYPFQRTETEEAREEARKSGRSEKIKPGKTGQTGLPWRSTPVHGIRLTSHPWGHVWQLLVTAMPEKAHLSGLRQFFQHATSTDCKMVHKSSIREDLRGWKEWEISGLA